MRTGFHQELDTLSESTAMLCFAVGELLGQATTALIENDLTVARGVLGQQAELHNTLAGLEDAAVRLLRCSRRWPGIFVGWCPGCGRWGSCGGWSPWPGTSPKRSLVGILGQWCRSSCGAGSLGWVRSDNN